ncbi:ROK family transcriptional regulator [Georgenia halophila]
MTDDVAVPRGTNATQLGNFNETVILHAIRRADGVSRVELGKATGLSPQTVTNICRRLLDEGLLVEGEKTTGGLGKRRTQLHIDASARTALGAHIDPALTTVTTLDLVGKPIDVERFPTPDDPEKAVAKIARVLKRLIAESGTDGVGVLGVGVGAPGPVDVARGVICDPPHLPNWRDVPVRDELAAQTGLPTVLEKDTIAAAVAETWAGTFTDGCSAIVLYLGTGIGAGLVIDGEVVRGTTHSAGEAGHLVVDPDGPPCACGLRGCINVAASPRALVEIATHKGVLPAPGPDDNLDSRLGMLYDLADAGEPAAREIVRRGAAGVARAALTIGNLVDVSRVVLGGPYWPRMSAYILDAAPTALEAATAASPLHPVALGGTKVGENLGAIGAASLVLDHAYTPRPTRLVLGRPERTGRSA